MIVAVVLLTTLLTPLMLRGAFHLKCAEDDEDSSDDFQPEQRPELSLEPLRNAEDRASAPFHSNRYGDASAVSAAPTYTQ